MEIKILCACGQKFKFDVEPVQGRMPWTVRCPVCHADDTAQANQIIQQAGATPGSPAVSIPSVGVGGPRPAPVSGVIPVARIISPPTVGPAPAPPAAASPTAPAPASQPVSRVAVAPVTAAPVPVQAQTTAAPTSGLRINKPVEPAHAAPAPAAGTVQPGGARPQTGDEDDEPTGGVRELRLSWSTKLWILLIVLLVIGNVGWKLYRKTKRTVNFVDTVSEAVVGAVKPEAQRNLWNDRGVHLLIKHDNEQAVAQACAQYWTEHLQKRLAVIDTNTATLAKNEMGVVAAHNGCVQLIGSLDWPQPQCEALTLYLSQKLNTTGVAVRQSSFSGAYAFAVFERGQKKFRAELEVKVNAAGDNTEETVKTESDTWATEHGFKPGKEGFKEFNVLDADVITKDLGFKLWDTSEHKTKILLRG